MFSIDFNVRATPVVAIPAGTPSTDYYSTGGGFFINTDIEFYDMFSAGTEFGYYIPPLKNTGTYPGIVAGGGGASTFFYPSSRIYCLLGTSGGIYQFSYDEYSYSNLWWKLYGEAGFRISPYLSVSAGTGYVNFRGSKEPMFSGILAGLSARYSFSTEAASGNIDFTLAQPEPVFPLLYGIYKQNSIGMLKIINNESSEIRNVTVSFQAENYTSSLFLCGRINLLKRREEAEIPLFADFSSAIQNFTENGQIPGELVIQYELLGVERTARKTLIIPVYNRNVMRWTDKSILASYISPNSPEVMDYSKYIVGVARNNVRSGLNRNMQFAMYLLEGLKTGGIEHSGDDTTPYKEYHTDPSLLDYIQYPFQTLSYRLGDYDDLGILYAAALESVGIKTALIPLPDDFIVAFNLEITPSQAESLFNDTGNLLTINNEIWMPVSLSVIRQGFVNCWYAAVKSITNTVAENHDIDVVILQDAWQIYPPSGIRGYEAGFQKPLESTVVRAVETDTMRYIAAEFGPKIKAVQEQITGTGGSVYLYNELGLLYVRAGMYGEAKTEFEKSVLLGSAAALVNLGNIGLLQRNYRAAADYFRQALKIEPSSEPARKGLETAEAQLEE